MAAMAPAAGASLGPVGLTLSPSSATAASTGNLGTDITFSPSGGDSAKDLTLGLPPGLLANAAIDGGACLKSATPVAACQVGSGTVTANLFGGPIPTALPATFDLVAPANPSQLAGLAVLVTAPGGQPTQLGPPAAVTIRPATDPAGVGLNIAFTDIPDTFDGLPLQLHEINGTFDGLRFPSSCPSTPVNMTVTADSYGDATPATAHAPLTVTGCGSVPYSPAFAVSVKKDTADDGVSVITDVTQTAAQATSGSVSLAFPTNALTPNLNVIGALCSNATSATCTPVGTAAAVTPLYPAYLTGSFTAPSLTIVFGPPFSQTLTGQVNLASNSTTFSGIPDFPLTDLKVSLHGGSKAVFNATCRPASGSATATLTSQNGDQTKQAAAPFTISPCTAAGAPGQSRSGTKGGKPPRIDGTSAAGLTTGKPSLVFQAVAGKNAGKLSVLTVELPRGLRFVRRVGKLTVPGVSLAGAKLKSAVLAHGHLVITLRKAVANVIVSLSGKALSESGSLKSQARHHKLKRLKLTVLVKDSRGKQTKVPVQIRNLHQPKK
jgi:hypothetical protein